MASDNPPIVTVAQLRAALADVDGDLPVLIVAYEGGFRNISRVLVAEFAFGTGGYASQHDRPSTAFRAGEYEGVTIGTALYLGDDAWGPYDEDVQATLISTDEQGEGDAGALDG